MTTQSFTVIPAHSYSSQQAHSIAVPADDTPQGLLAVLSSKLCRSVAVRNAVVKYNSVYVEGKAFFLKGPHLKYLVIIDTNVKYLI